MSEGGAQQPALKDRRNWWSDEEDGVSQLKGLVATVRSLHLLKRNSRSHRIGTLMEFDICQVENIVGLWPRRARKEIKIGSLATGR